MLPADSPGIQAATRWRTAQIGETQPYVAHIRIQDFQHPIIVVIDAVTPPPSKWRDRIPQTQMTQQLKV